MRGARSEVALERHVARACAFASGETIVVAASGGADSTALAALAAGAATAAGATIVLGHVNHALRPSAFADEAVVLAIGASLRVRVVARSLEPGGTDEARLRADRYARLVEIAKAVGATRVLAAHHARDQTETVLLALFRGTGPTGLAGMAPARALTPEIGLARPLLDVEPEVLRGYCERRHLPYALDPSNRDLDYRRNAVRAALAALRGSFPRLDAAVARYARLARESDGATTERAEIRASLHASLRARGLAGDVTFERLDAAADAIEGARPGRHFLGRGVEIVVE